MNTILSLYYLIKSADSSCVYVVVIIIDAFAVVEYSEYIKLKNKGHLKARHVSVISGKLDVHPIISRW